MYSCFVCGKEQSGIGYSRTVSVIDKHGEPNVPRSVVLCFAHIEVESVDLRITIGK